MTADLLEDLRAALPGYRIDRELSGGGMSRVFLAEETALSRRVVIKTLQSATSVAADRFEREILLSARLQHPHIVPVLSAGTLGGQPFFIMPYVEGESLRARLERHGPLDVAECVRLIRSVAAALAYAHDRGVVHRDLKPDNIMVSSGVAVVLDFGVAKALDASGLTRSDSLTTGGIAIGTPAYMAPEQAVGDQDVDARADIYAFGAVAYELLTASTPFGKSDAVRVLRAQVLEPPPPIVSRRSDIPPPIARLVMRCLEKDRAARPQSATEILDLLDSVATPMGTRVTTLRERVTRGGRQLAAASVPALIYAIACAVTVAGLRWLTTQELVSTRLVVFAMIASLLGLPVVVAAGLVLEVRRTE